jgi:hypothetical protein
MHMIARFSSILRKPLLLAGMLAFLISFTLSAAAQTAGEGAIQGTVADSTGAIISGATVTAINVATNVHTVRQTTSAGLYNIAPLPAGTYTIQVTAKGFKGFEQENIVVDALGSRTVSPTLSVGATNETVIITAAPPVLDTDNATLGTTIENTTYSNLPILMSTVTLAQRDPTAFASLTTGAQASTSALRPAIIGGMGNNLQQLYLDGMPAETINQQADTRLVGLNVSVDAIDQFQVVTSVPPVEYSGAGALNFNMKSGGNQYHGQVSDYIRNTIFDAWGFTNKWVPIVTNPATTLAACINSPGRSLCQKKPYEHQNELSAVIGGKVPFTHDKLFVFFAYDRYQGNGPDANSPQYLTVATSLMRNGDFTELNGNPGTGQTGVGANNPAFIFDPTSNNCPTPTTCTRTAFHAIKNGIDTNNIIPTADQSSISLAMQAFLPAPSDPTTISKNYIGTRVAGNNNHLEDLRVDYDLRTNNRISFLAAMGTNHFLNNFSQNANSTVGGYGFLPLPYTGGDLASVYPKQFVFEDTYTITPHVVNQFKYGYTRFFMDIHNATDGVPQYRADTLGITNFPTPTGQATTDFPSTTFATPSGTIGTGLGGSPTENQWGQGAAAATTITSPATFAIVDNVQWIKGHHAFTFGGTVEFLQVKNTSGATGLLTLPYGAVTTANYGSGSVLSSTGQGFGYASFLIGAVGGTGSTITQAGLAPQIDSRYKTFAPYVEDNWKVNSKLTLDLGLRWDYLQPYHELKNHYTFLNPTAINTITGTPGAMEFAGNGDPSVYCNCKTPVKTDWKNFGPRIGFAYSLDSKTVIRGGFAIVYSFGGGTGGGRSAGGGGLGAGQSLGFSTSANLTTPEVTSGPTAGPAYWLNPSTAYLGAAANRALGYTYPATPTAATLASEVTLNTGNYVSGGKVVAPGSQAYEDPINSGVPPEFTLYNLGFERSLTRDMTLTVNYSGNESHHAFEVGGGGNPRGLWVNQLDPRYLATLGSVSDSTGTKPILTAPATTANIAKARTASGLALPMPGGDSGYFVTAANFAPGTGTLTLAQALVAFPQYSAISDGWGANVQNFSYNSLQVTLTQRTSHGLTFNLNYTFSKNIGDDGTFRSGYNLPAATIDGGNQSFKQDRIDRSWTTISQPNVFNAFGVYQIPLGSNGHFGSGSLIGRSLLNGWILSGIYQFANGTPVAIVSNTCSGQAANAGQCMPSLTPGAHSARINGAYGSGPNGTNFGNLSSVKYIDYTAFSQPVDLAAGQCTSAPLNACSAKQYLIGNAPRTAPYGLRNPGVQNVNAGLKRNIALSHGMSLGVEANVQNLFNRVQFGNPGATWAGSPTSGTVGNAFGEVTSIQNQPRSWQFAGHIYF